MDFIKEKDAAVGLLYKAGPVGVGARVRPFFYAHELAQQKLGVVGIVCAVKVYKRCVFRQAALFVGIFIYKLGKHRFAYACFAEKKHVHSVRRVQYGGFGLFHAVKKAPVAVYESIKHKLGALLYGIFGDFIKNRF